MPQPQLYGRSGSKSICVVLSCNFVRNGRRAITPWGPGPAPRPAPPAARPPPWPSAASPGASPPVSSACMGFSDVQRRKRDTLEALCIQLHACCLPVPEGSSL